MTDSYCWVWEEKDGTVVAAQVEYDDEYLDKMGAAGPRRAEMTKRNRKDIAKFCSDAIKHNCIPKRLPSDDASRLLREGFNKMRCV